MSDTTKTIVLLNDCLTEFVCDRYSVIWVVKPVNYNGLHMKKGAIIIRTTKRVVYCDHFPETYKGKNPTLHVWEFDHTFGVWEKIEFEKSWYTYQLFLNWKLLSHRKKPTPDEDYRSIMWDGLRKKKKACPRPEMKDELQPVKLNYKPGW